MDELEAVVEGQPFGEPSNEDTKLYVRFLHEEPADDGVAGLPDAGNEAEEFVVRGRGIYSELRKDLPGDGRLTDAGNGWASPPRDRTGTW